MNDTQKPPELDAHALNVGGKLNWLRASVLGANDGIVSISALVVGVAGASNSSGFILTAGVAGVLAGALSMAVGEYVSVSTQRDTEHALLAKERRELAADAENELLELANLYKAKGLSQATATQVAKELTEHDAFTAHADIELRIDPHNLTNPWHAAFASALSFLVGAAIPLIAITIPPPNMRIAVTFIAVLIALVLTGSLSAHAGDANKMRAVFRVVIGGALAMAITFWVGHFFNV